MELKNKNLLLFGLALIFLSGLLYLSSPTILQTIDIYKTSSQTKTIPGKYNAPDSLSCKSDSDCGIDLCSGCKAMNKEYITPEDTACTVVCEGTPQCVDSQCKLVQKLETQENCYYQRIVCKKAPCDPILTCSGKNQSLIMAVVNDLATRLKVTSDTVIVNSVNETAWGDSSLGCPEPGKVYTQAVVGGYKISLTQGDKTYLYHTGLQERFVLCDKP